LLEWAKAAWTAPGLNYLEMSAPLLTSQSGIYYREEPLSGPEASAGPFSAPVGEIIIAPRKT